MGKRRSCSQSHRGANARAVYQMQRRIAGSSHARKCCRSLAPARSLLDRHRSFLFTIQPCSCDSASVLAMKLSCYLHVVYFYVCLLHCNWLVLCRALAVGRSRPSLLPCVLRVPVPTLVLIPLRTRGCEQNSADSVLLVQFACKELPFSSSQYVPFTYIDINKFTYIQVPALLYIIQSRLA